MEQIPKEVIKVFAKEGGKIVPHDDSFNLYMEWVKWLDYVPTFEQEKINKLIKKKNKTSEEYRKVGNYYYYKKMAELFKEYGTKNMDMEAYEEVLMFMKQAENIVRKMFGFDKVETIGTLGAAATGGLVMNAVNAMKRPPKEEKEGKGGGQGGKEGKKDVRTAKEDPLKALKGENTQSGGQDGVDYDRANRFRQLQEEGMSQEEAMNRLNEEMPFNTNEAEQAAQTVQAQQTQQSQEEKEEEKKINKTLKGVKALAGRYLRPAFGKTAGVLLGAAGGAIGFASGAAQGDIGKAITGMAAGGTAGYYSGQKMTNAGVRIAHTATHLNEKVENVVDTFNEGAEGADFVKNAKFDREFKRSEAYEKLQNMPNFTEENVDAMLEAGITDAKAMEKILKNSNGNIGEGIGYYTLAKKCPDSVYYDDRKLQRYLEDLGLSQTDAETMRRNMKAYRG